MSRITSTTPLNAIVTKDSLVNIVRKVDCHNFKTLLRWVLILFSLICFKVALRPYDIFER